MQFADIMIILGYKQSLYVLVKNMYVVLAAFIIHFMNFRGL